MHMEVKRAARKGYIIALVVVVIFAAFSWWQRFFLIDQVRLWGYQPPAAVSQLATDTTMTSPTRRVFYAQRPELLDRDSFAKHCKVTEKTIVLGCYVSTQGIFLHNVSDSRLKGIMEVTAAHEMLHAAYARLNPLEKRRVDALLREAYAGVTDERVKRTIQLYQDSGADTTNELHSILPTEIRYLSPELEHYYTRFFSNRSAIVAFSEKYQAEFSSRRDQVAAADETLKTLRSDIDVLNASLSTRATIINDEFARLTTLKNAGQIEAFNAGVALYNQKVKAYNADVNKVQELIEQYNNLVNERNAIAVEQNQLNQAIDSRPSVIETQ